MEPSLLERLLVIPLGYSQMALMILLLFCGAAAYHREWSDFRQFACLAAGSAVVFAASLCGMIALAG